MSGVSLDQIKAKLSEITKTSNPDPEIVTRCFEIATTFGLSVEDLGNRWEAYVINKKLESTIPNMKELLRFSDGKRPPSTIEIHTRLTSSYFTNVLRDQSAATESRSLERRSGNSKEEVNTKCLFIKMLLILSPLIFLIF